MNMIDKEKIKVWYEDNFEKKLSGLRILFDDIEPLIKSSKLEKEQFGSSENNIPIYKFKLGSGKKRVLLWSQMHGNESTGTKALFDLFNFFENPKEFLDVRNLVLKNCTIIIVPMLNPDGAINYTRENANGIDLNRDAVDLKAKESNLLRGLLDSFNPHFCFNLHDQRSIFNVSGTSNPATISFLAPSTEIERKITKGRTETMSVIVSMDTLLQKFIPNHVGKYTDEFYPTATGDNFQKLGHNTILIEAGHYPGDYSREKTRAFNFYAILQGLLFLANTDDYSSYESYFDIPENDKKYFDKLYRNTKLTLENDSKTQDIGILYKYNVVDGKLAVYEEVDKVGDLSSYFGYVVKDFKGKPYN